MYAKKASLALPRGFTPPHLLSGMCASSPILVGFSGGADSTAMLHMLALYAKDSGAPIYAAHLNHGIRGEEADRDQRFCKSFCDGLGIVFISKKVNIPSIAEESGESIESAARRVRYEFFADIMREHRIRLLATAHNADDNLETMLFNLARGTGLRGICGIPQCRPCSEGMVIRPVLAMEKSEILEYCLRNGLEFVTDSTNRDTDYTRNKIRSEILPVMKQINSGAVKNAYRTSQSLRDDSICIEILVKQFKDEALKDGGIELQKLCCAPTAVTSRALMEIYSEQSKGGSLEAVHIRALRELAANAVPHSSASLPSGFEGIIEDGKLYIQKSIYEDLPESYEVSLSDGKNYISQTKCEIFIGNSHNAKNIYKKSILLSFHSDKIKGKLIARNRLGGDKIKMCGMSKSVKKLMCEKKIPPELRYRLPVICDDDGILAIPFVGIRDGAVCKESTESTAKTNIYFYLY